MKKETKVIFIGNYLSDKQESMIRFANLLCSGFQTAGYSAEIWWPKAVLGKSFTSTSAGFAKWIGYIDKWVLFPITLRKWQKREDARHGNVRYHVCDHSNSLYLPYLPPDRTGITCHDVLAIRGAMGYSDAYVSASSFGKILQKKILHNLLKASLLACNSKNTYNQLLLFAQRRKVNAKNDWRVIYLSYNGEYKPIQVEEAWKLVNASGVPINTPFILHVGNSLMRKNRMFLLDVIAAPGNDWPGYICYAGKVDDAVLLSRAENLGLKERVILIARPDNETLRALYSVCTAFTYPSLSEGFPWPVIEAQACGAPVVTSNIEPMPEISGEGALHGDPLNANQFAHTFRQLLDKEFRKKMIGKGFENAARFAPPKMIDDYLVLHNLTRKNL